MKTKNIFGFLVMTFAMAFLLATPAMAFADRTEVVINGVECDAGCPVIGLFAGDTISVRVSFTGNLPVGEFEEEARITARILGEPGLSEVSDRFDVVGGSAYSRLLTIELPSDLDDDLNDRFVLEVTVESNRAEAFSEQIQMEIQRENDLLDILAVESENEVKAGENVALDIIVKNRGRHEAEDVFVRASIPALGISRMVFLGDIDAQDSFRTFEGTREFDSDFEDSAFGRVFLKIPRDAPAGVYNIEVEVFDDDSTTIAVRKVVVVGSGSDSSVISSATSRTFGTGAEQEYTVTIVNADSTIKVYELVLEAANGLTVSLDQALVAIPAGNSKTVRLTAMASDEGNYNFAVNVHSGGELVKKQNFVANVEGRGGAGAGNAAVVLTVILAIIFVVLLIVLIVLLTRKPEKAEDFGESYY